MLAPLFTPLYCLFVQGLMLDRRRGRAALHAPAHPRQPSGHSVSRRRSESQRTYAELVIALTHRDGHLRDSIGEGDDETEGTP